MVESFWGSLGVSDLIVSSLVGLYFITRIPWWMRKVCVPNVEVVDAVQANALLWRQQARELIPTVPERLSWFGFLAFLIWPVMVLLNIFLLAEVLKLVPPGGLRATILGMGPYTHISLLGGLLFSISQTVFSVAAGEVKRKSLVIVFLMLTFATIVIEMGLAGFHAATIYDVDSLAAGSVGYQLVSNGVLRAMLLAFFIPLAHCVLGSLAVPRFYIPLTAYLPRLIFGLLCWLWTWFCAFYFGFQELRPAAASSLMDSIKALAERVQSVAAEARALGGSIPEMPRNAAGRVQPHKELEQKLAALRDKVVREEKQYRQCQERRGELVLILKPSGAAEQFFSDARDKELADIRLAALDFTSKRKRALAMKQYARCLDLLANRLRNELEQVRATLDGVSRQIDELERVSSGRQGPPDEDVAKSGRRLA